MDSTIVFVHLFHFCCLHLDCLGIIRKLCEQLRTYPSKDPTTVNWWQVMVNVRLGGGVGVHLLRYWHLSTCGYSSKILDAKKLPYFSANMPSFNKLTRYETKRIALKFGQKTPKISNSVFNSWIARMHRSEL